LQNTISYKTYLDRVYGCFLGKTVIGTLGAPFEGVKMPMELPFRREMIDAMLPNDDLDLQILWLDVVEERGEDFTSRDLLKRFCDCCPYDPGEYSVMRKNYKRGIYPPLSGKYSNDFYINGMGCPIRSEIWACLAPLNPQKAADLCTRDGVLDHEGDSVYAERFFAAMESAAFGEDDLDTLVEIGLEYVPASCQFRSLVEDARALCKQYDDQKLILRKLLFRYGHPDCTNLYQNVAIILIALYKNDLDLIKTGMAALNCGFDTDCTCATAGAVLGVMFGAERLIKEYDLPAVRFVAGVTTHRRSDLVSDLSEDIALLGSVLSTDTVTDAPAATYDFKPSQYPLSMWMEYENDDPTFSPLKPCHCTLWLENVSPVVQKGSVKVSGACFAGGLEISLEAGEKTSYPMEIAFPAEEKIISDTNLFEAVYQSGETEERFTFGVVGAMPWKVIGPIWRTDPICNTQLLLENDLKYKNILAKVPYDGLRTDISRRFHLNFAVDTDSEYMAHDDCFTAYDPAKETAYEETVFYQHKDSFTMDDLYGFQGPSVAYLAREIVCPEDRTLFVQIGHSSPFTLWINGEKLAERKNCDTWDAENVHLADVKLKKGVNRVLLRLTRVNADAKYNLFFSKRATCGEHYTDLSALRPEFF